MSKQTENQLLREALADAKDALLRVKNFDWSEDSRNGKALLARIEAAIAQPAQPAEGGEVVTDERSAFEAWAESLWHDTSKFDGAYKSSGTNMIWCAWQARAALAQPAEGGEAAEVKADLLYDSAYLNGAKFGWNCAATNDQAAMRAMEERYVKARLEARTTPPASQELLLKLAAIAAECSDQDTTDALDQLIAATPASHSQAQQPSPQAWANETGLRQIECPSCGDLAVAYDPQQPSGEVVAVPVQHPRSVQWVLESIEAGNYASYQEAWRDLLTAAGADLATPKPEQAGLA